MYPKLISIGDFFLPAYGVLVATAFLTALWLAARLARKSGLNPDDITNLGALCALAGLAGAKLLLLLFDIDYYSKNPGEIFTLSTLRAGGVFHGGLIVALVVAFFFMRSKKMPALATLDVYAPGLALGHAIGRIGCFLAGCCWGEACSRPWAVTFRDLEAHRLVGVPLNTPLHPTQLYEAAAEGLAFVVLYRSFHRPHRAGAVMGLYLMLYSVARFAIDFLRHHDQANPWGGPLSTTQWLAFGLFAVGVWLLLRKGGETQISPTRNAARPQSACR